MPCSLPAAALLLLALAWSLPAATLSFSRDLVPLSTVGLTSTSQYPWFRGLAGDNDTAQLGLDFQRMLRLNQTLFVAARDHVYAFDLQWAKELLCPDRYLTWKTQDVDNCAMRGKLRDECYNYIKVLVPKDDRTLFACGTNAFNPMCRTYKISSLEQEGEELNGQARCPFDAKQTNVALFADGNLYSATVADFQASDAVIYRSLGERSPMLRTVKYDSKWLREPHFLHALEHGSYVYFFFREISMEYTTLGRVVFSRVARVCKNDMGGSPRVLEKYWTSFLKARLNCSVPGDSFFYFDVLQAVTGVAQLNGRPAVFGVFTTQANSITGSAVCAFYLDDIERVFSGRFKEQRSTDAAWTPVPEDKVPKPRPGSCAGSGTAGSYRSSSEFPDETLAFIKSYPLLDEAVPSATGRPLFTQTASRYRLTQLAVDPGAGPHRNRTVLFLGAEDGTVLKVLVGSTANTSLEPLLLEDISLYSPARCTVRQEDRRILGLELDTAHHVLYVAFSGCMVRVPLSRCEAHGACRRSCLASRDPYCVWLRTGACVAFGNDIRAGFEQDVENAAGSLGGCQDVATATGNRNGASDSAYGNTGPTASVVPYLAPTDQSPVGTAPDAHPAPGPGDPRSTLRVAVSTQGVRQDVEGRDGAKTVHFTFLIGCVLVAFVLGAASAGLLVSCYCSHLFQKAKRAGKEPEGALPRPLSLRSLAKMNGLLDAAPGKDGRPEGPSPKLYTTLLPQEKEPPRAKEHPELSGLPTPESTPELPVKNVVAVRSPWERNHNANNAKEGQGKAQLFPGTATQGYPFASGLRGYDMVPGGCGEERKAPHAERVLVRPSAGMEVTTLEELLRHLHEATGPPHTTLGGMPLAQPAASPPGALSFANRVQPKIPDTESAPYYSSSTLPRDSLPRRLDVPPDPAPQPCPEKQPLPRPPGHRHSLVNVGGGGGGLLSRQHSLSQAARPHPPLLTRVHSAGTPGPLAGHAAFLPRQRQGSLPQAAGGGIKGAGAAKPSVPPKPLFVPSSPVKPAGQFNY
ncbi:PREDICTED: semaphorin-6C isoform X1 [Crocodylus porosus]|uniref:Semaphorin 6C n=1 Tax=Crocodylus porosus TaxID=8502 RepID=A0A7M4EJA1_CROPO|nr:PREDICTED: semaphorin-6C isoform X1 [Crocodylus porosus]